nr:MAG TPA: hypothetical protein [Caudoviricetes sp.]
MLRCYLYEQWKHMQSAIICPERMSLNCFINVKYLKNYDSA